MQDRARNAALTAVVVLLCLSASSHGATVVSQACSEGMVTANQCLADGIKAGSATACNWYIVIPFLENCIRPAVSLCFVEYVQFQDDQIALFNETLNSPDCNAACGDQQVRLLKTVACRIIHDYTNSVNLINAGLTASCGNLQGLKDCLTEVNLGCPALQEIAIDEGAAIGADQAFTKCGISQFSPPATVLPFPDNLEIVDGVIMYKGSGGDDGDDGDGPTSTADLDEGGLATIYIVFIVVGILGLLIMLVACFCVCRGHHKRNGKSVKDINDLDSDSRTTRTSGSYFRPPQAFNSRQYRPANMQSYYYQ